MDHRFPRRTKSDGLVTNALGFVRVYSDVQLHKTEEVLEAEIRRESCYPAPDEKVARVRLRGERILHSKHVLLTVVILNLIDCALVLGELILDIHYIRELRTEADMTSQRFIDTLQQKYPDNLYGYDIENLKLMYEKLYEAQCRWDDQNLTRIQVILQPDHLHDNGTLPVRPRRTNHDVRLSRGPQYAVQDAAHNDSEHTDAQQHHHHEHSVWEHVAHGMHKASITILGILFIENLVKLICMGRAFLMKKLEVFDSIVVIISFIVDLVLLKGLSEFSVQDAVFVLTFLLPWRVIRVVNSLIVAVLDQEHFRLKMLYQEKKVVSAELKILKDKEKRWDFHLQKIEKFCESEGIPKWKIRQHTAMGRKQSTITSMASLALNGFLQGMVLSPSDKELFDKSISMNCNCSPTLGKNYSYLDVISESDNDTDDDTIEDENEIVKKEQRAYSAVQFIHDELDDNISEMKMPKSESKATIKSVTFEAPKEKEMKPLLSRQESFEESKEHHQSDS